MSKEIVGNLKGRNLKGSKRSTTTTTTILNKLLLLQRDGEVLIIVSYEDAFLYTSSHDSDWILDSSSPPTMLPQANKIYFL
jgi:hypothetical protein